MGSDPFAQNEQMQTIKFQLTLPVWGATGADNGVTVRYGFQLTLPVWGATRENRKHWLLH